MGRESAYEAVGVPKRPTALNTEMAGPSWSTYAGEVAHPSKILAKSDIGLGVGDLYDEMLLDPTISGLWGKRVDAVAGLPRRIEPNGSSPKAKEIADFCRAATKGVKNFAINVRHQMQIRTHGVAFDEIVWTRRNCGNIRNAYVPKAIIDRPMRRFGFTTDGKPFVRKNGVKKTISPERLILSQAGTKDTPWGRGEILDPLYWYWWLKKHGWKYFALAIEKWAQPTVKGSYPHETGNGEIAKQTNDQRKSVLLDAIGGIETDVGFVIPSDVEISLLEASQSGMISYESFLAMIDRNYALVILGEVDTSGLSKGPGSYAKSKVSDDVRLEKITADAHDVGANFTDSYLAPLVLFNYGPSAMDMVPHFVLDADDAKSKEQLRVGAQFILDQGLPLTEEHVYRIGEAAIPRDGEETVGGEVDEPEPAPEPIPEPIEEEEEAA